MDLSVIIPTYNRKDKLGECLKALSCQAAPTGGFEVLVIDDGSTDGTHRTDEVGWAANVRYLRQEHSGPAAARNLGILNAAGKVLLFLGDDIMAGPGLLQEHAAWHAAAPAPERALLGYVTWDVGLKVTPFMWWLENGGPQFRYNELTSGAEIDAAEFFYTCNLSVKKDFLMKNGLFDEDFRGYGFEDVELGARLKKKGLRLYYDKAARAGHDHMTSLRAACARMKAVGAASGLFMVKTGGGPEVPERVSLLWRFLRRARFALYYPLALVLEHTAPNAHVFKYVMWYCRREGAEKYRASHGRLKESAAKL